MEPIVFSWVAKNLIEAGRKSYSAVEVEETLIHALNPTKEELQAKGDSDSSYFVNHQAHVLRKMTRLGYHIRNNADRSTPYQLTEKGQDYFKRYYGDRHHR